MFIKLEDNFFFFNPDQDEGHCNVKLQIVLVDENEWISSPDEKYQTVWIKDNGSNLMKKDINLKIEWANKSQSNSMEKRLISKLIPSSF